MKRGRGVSCAARLCWSTLTCLETAANNVRYCRFHIWVTCTTPRLYHHILEHLTTLFRSCHSIEKDLQPNMKA